MPASGERTLASSLANWCRGTYGCHDWPEGDAFLVYLWQAVDSMGGGGARELMCKFVFDVLEFLIIDSHKTSAVKLCGSRGFCMRIRVLLSTYLCARLTSARDLYDRPC